MVDQYLHIGGDARDLGTAPDIGADESTAVTAVAPSVVGVTFAMPAGSVNPNGVVTSVHFFRLVAANADGRRVSRT